MNVKRFFSKRLNLLLFVTVMFALVGLLFGFVVPNTLFNNRLNAIETELHDLAFNHESITEVDSTQILYIYKDGDSSMLTSTGYITDIDEEVEHHLIHWSEDQFVESLLYKDDFQNKLFIYYIYVVEDDYYVVSFADTKEVHMFVDTFRTSSLISVIVLYIISILFTSTFFSSSLIKQYSLFDPVTNLNTKISLFNKYNKKDLSNYKITYNNIYNLEDVIDACGVRYNDDILKMISMNILKNYNTNTIYQISASEYISLDNIADNNHTDFHEVINQRDETMTTISPYEFKTKTVNIDSTTLKDININTLIKRFNFAFAKIKSTKDASFDVDKTLVDEMEQELYYQSHLGSAISGGSIINYYQPKVNPSNNKIIGAEALSRWLNEDGIISPAKYIHLAETNGMIYDIDLISFSNSINFIKELENKNLLNDDFKISSNFSPITLKNVTFKQIKQIIESADVNPKHISIEITESVVLEFEFINELLLDLSNYGITIEIDDFSAGNSSFTMLSLLKANVVKLDRAILPEKDEDEREKLIYHSLVDISKKLGLKIISEGVETNIQKSFVKELGVEGIQGYFYSKPLDKDKFIDYLKKD